MALYDIMGKALGVPAFKLMGPKVRGWIPVAAWTVDQEPQAMAEEVRQAAARGYHWMKYHVGEVQNVIDQTRAMQEAAPPGFKVHYDFNANSNYYTMKPVLDELARFAVVGRFEGCGGSRRRGWLSDAAGAVPVADYCPPRARRIYGQGAGRRVHGRPRAHWHGAENGRGGR